MSTVNPTRLKRFRKGGSDSQVTCFGRLRGLLLSATSLSILAIVYAGFTLASSHHGTSPPSITQIRTQNSHVSSLFEEISRNLDTSADFKLQDAKPQKLIQSGSGQVPSVSHLVDRPDVRHSFASKVFTRSPYDKSGPRGTGYSQNVVSVRRASSEDASIEPAVTNARTSDVRVQQVDTPSPLDLATSAGPPPPIQVPQTSKPTITPRHEVIRHSGLPQYIEGVHARQPGGSRRGQSLYESISKRHQPPPPDSTCGSKSGQNKAYAWIFKGGAALQYVHMASIAALQDGRLIAAWQAAKIAEGEDDQVLMYAFSDDKGATWGKATKVPGRDFGVRWSPTLFQPPGPRTPLHLFFAESRGCWWCEIEECFKRMQKKGFQRPQAASARRRLLDRQAKPKSKSAPVNPKYLVPHWRPGGDIKVMKLDPYSQKWSDPQLIFPEAAEGDIPKVIGNPPMVGGSADHWVLPYWREKPRGDAVCSSDAPDYSGVLSTRDGGSSWGPLARIEFQNKIKDLPRPDWLIEGTAAQLKNGSMIQLFRTNRNRIYRTISADGGLTWQEPVATSLPNPNSKVNLLRLEDGRLVCAHNAHEFTKTKEGVTRGKLTVSISSDEGETWDKLAVADHPWIMGMLIHYPTMIQVGCRLLVAYSVGGVGIRVLSLDI